MIKVSVIMPVYNVEKYLEEALLSVMKQTLHEIEIICVNDGSTDSSFDILQRYAKLDERIKVISKDNTGYGHTMNIGLDAAIGEYVGIVETDDYIDQKMLETLYRTATQKQLDIVKAGYRWFVDEDGERIFHEIPILPLSEAELYEKVTGSYEDMRVFRADMVTWAGIYRRDFLNKHNIRHNETPGASYQDNGFWFQVMMHAKKVGFIEDSFYNLRRDNPNSSVKNTEKVFCICDEYDFIRDRIESSSIGNKKRMLQTAFYYRFLNYQFHYIRVSDELKPAMMERVREDVIYALENGDIAADMYTKAQWQQLFFIMNEGKMIAPSNVFMSGEAKKRIEEAKAVYIYGAGAWGKNIYHMLRGYIGTEKIKAFLVTKMEEQQESLFDIPVRVLDRVDLTEDDLVIIAVSDKYLGEVLMALEHRGYNNSILKNDLF